jgi:hypothetical protein
MNGITPLVGVVLLLILARDVYATVFVPRGPAGAITGRFYSGAWACWSAVVRRLASGRSRRVWLSRLGPLLVPATLVLWGAELILGFALIYYPWANQFILPDRVGEFSAWGTAFYYSAYSATTLGVGDIFPRSMGLRIVSAVEAASGFALFSFAISYLVSIYSTLSNATAQAVEIWHLVGRDEGKDPVDALITVIDRDGETDLVKWLVGVSSRLAMVTQSGGQYPLIRYFHEPEDGRAFPVAIADLLELLTLARSLLAPARFPSLSAGIITVTIWRLARQYVTEGARRVGGSTVSEESLQRERVSSYRQARRRLAAAGVPLREESESWECYSRLRAEWDAEDRRFRDALGYPLRLPESQRRA